MLGGGRPKGLDRGYYVEPTVFSDVDPSRWPDPDALLASLEDLRNAHALSNR